jgi:heme exporter protein A
MSMKIVMKNIAKDFGDKKIFKGIDIELDSGQSLAIVGPNGSGKTTLVKIICGLIRPSAGEIVYSFNGLPINKEDIYRHISLVSPYLELYEELSARENLNFFGRMRRVKDLSEQINRLMKLMNLAGREDDPVKTYSSGMRQRLKYVFALLNEPEVLVLDEPTSNLDRSGTDCVYEIMENQKKDKILILATNDEEDLIYGDSQVAVNV